MAAKTSQSAKLRPKSPAWVIDTHGLNAALECPSNRVRDGIIAAIEAGQMWLLKPVSHELKEMYEQHYKQLQAFSYKRYLEVTVQAQITAGIMMEAFGAPLLGGQPALHQFEAVAVAHHNGCKLVSAGKALRSCRAIAKTAGLDGAAVVAFDELP
jgi:hypothetical protein